MKHALKQINNQLKISLYISLISICLAPTLISAGTLKIGVTLQHNLYSEPGFHASYQPTDSLIFGKITYTTTKSNLTTGKNALKKESVIVSVGTFFADRDNYVPSIQLDMGKLWLDRENNRAFKSLKEKWDIMAIGVGIHHKMTRRLGFSSQGKFNINSSVITRPLTWELEAWSSL